ncbi:MAG: hypothetical protein R3F24_08070 [Gammaproteobacteria bacterium]
MQQAQLMAGVFEQHDRDRFGDRIFVRTRRDLMRRRLEAAFDEFHDVRW